jgi:hypothetical protein
MQATPAHPLAPAGLGLPADPADWTDAQTDAFAEAVNGLPEQAAPTPMVLGLPADPSERTDVDCAVQQLAYELWMPVPPEDGGVAITNGSICRQADGQITYGPNHGRVAVTTGHEIRREMARDDYLRRGPIRRRRATPEARRTVGRARSRLRAGRPSCSRRTSSTSSASSGDPPSSAPGEPAPIGRLACV